MVMFQRLDLPTLVSEYSPDPIPEEYNPNKLPKVCINQVVFF